MSNSFLCIIYETIFKEGTEKGTIRDAQKCVTYLLEMCY